MNRKTYLFFSFLIVLISCGNNNISSQKASPKNEFDPVETEKPNTRYKPAFEGQTRVGGVKTTTPYKVELLTEGLQRPWGIAPMPDGRLLITSITGYMTLHDANGRQLSKITGFPPVVARGQGGMLDVALDPDFKQNRIIYWSFSEKYGNGNLTSVARGSISADETKIENPAVIFRATPDFESNLHFGSRIVFDSAGHMYVSGGERSNPEGRKQAQWLTSGLGKIFKITREGRPAPGNPFLSTPNAMPEIYSYGNRNVQSLDIHPETGELWEAEFGPRGGDELNLIKPGKNYGWPTITYGLEYIGFKIGEGLQKKEGMEQPVYYWDPSISPSGMAFYAGDDIPEWKNNLFIGCLSGIHIARLVISGEKIIGEERLLGDKGERFRDVAYFKGMLYTVTDNGKLYRISKK
jgi:glucose/arabinose dehydrogenase